MDKLILSLNFNATDTIYTPVIVLGSYTTFRKSHRDLISDYNEDVAVLFMDYSGISVCYLVKYYNVVTDVV